jgi:hypothetical protein
MTDLIDRADSGDIHRPIGEDRTVILRRDTTTEDTRNLAHEIAGLPPRRRPAADETVRMRLIEPALGLNHHDMARVIEIDDTVTFGLAGPQGPAPAPKPPRPSVPPQYDMTATVDGELVPAGPGEVTERLILRRSVPYVIPADAEPWFGARHRRPAPAWTRWAIGVGTLAVIWSAVMLAVIW